MFIMPFVSLDLQDSLALNFTTLIFQRINYLIFMRNSLKTTETVYCSLKFIYITKIAAVMLLWTPKRIINRNFP